MKYTKDELDQKIRGICPAWLLEEIDEFLSMVKIERESDPESWGDYTTSMDALDTFSGQDWTDTRKYKLAITKIDRAIGVQVKLGKGEECVVCSSSGCRTYREGDWVFDKKWEELIKED